MKNQPYLTYVKAEQEQAEADVAASRSEIGEDVCARWGDARSEADDLAGCRGFRKWRAENPDAYDAWHADQAERIVVAAEAERTLLDEDGGYPAEDGWYRPDAERRLRSLDRFAEDSANYSVVTPAEGAEFSLSHTRRALAQGRLPAPPPAKVEEASRLFWSIARRAANNPKPTPTYTV